jgi:imidazolonepropionase-like amidohydrolase
MRPLTVALLACALPLAAQQSTLAITNVSVIPMTSDTIIRGATVVIRDGKIVSVGRGITAPRGARVIDGAGKYVIPGLADMHTHLFSDPAAVPDSIAPAELGVMLANGVTTARLMIGTPYHLQLRRDIAAGTVLGPRLWVASPHVSGIADENIYHVTTPEQARAAVAQAAEAGYDFVKQTFISRPVYDAMIAEARSRGIRVVGHVDPQVTLARALEPGQQLEHLDSVFEALLADSSPIKESVTQYGVYKDANWRSLDYIDDRKIAPLAGAVARSGAVIGPTLNVFNVAFAKPQTDSALHSTPDWAMWPLRLRDGYLKARAKYWGPASLEHRTEPRRKRYVEIRNRVVKAIQDSGGTIIAGSDTPEFFHMYGWGLHSELAAYVEAGLTPYQALRTATVNPAAYLRASATAGTIEPGKRADLVLLHGNPLENISNTTKIAGVVVGGRWLARDELDRMIARGRVAIGSGGR